MKLISSENDHFEDEGTYGKQECGMVFWQKTGFLRHCNELGFSSIVKLIEKKYTPTKVEFLPQQCFITFDNDENKMIYLTLKPEKDLKHLYIYGESHTVYAGIDFHIKSLEIVLFIAKQIGSDFFVNDATAYIDSKDKNALENYIAQFKEKSADYLKE